MSEYLEKDPETSDSPAGTVLSESVGYVLECKQDGVWRSFTAIKTDLDDVLRTYAFGKERDPDEEVRPVEIHTVVTVRDIGELQRRAELAAES